LAVLTVATVAITVALVPGHVGVRAWIVGSAVVVGLLAVGVLVNSLRTGHNSVRAVSVGPALAALAILLGSFWASAVVVEASMTPFDTPYATASVKASYQEMAAQLPVDEQRFGRAAATVPPDRAVNVLETTEAAGVYVMATGREYLPVGGFGGAVPATTLPTFERLVAKGRVERVTVVTKPLTNAPVLRWVDQHCTNLGITSYDPTAQATSTEFKCLPGDVPGS
jgi:hypothetical protein